MVNFSAFICFIFLIFVNNPAHAYIDPGSASFIIQSIIAGIVGAFVTLGLYWYKFKQFVKNLFSKKSNKK